MLGPDMCSLLPLIHAISGCDTTSRMFGVGKGITLKKFEESEFVKAQAHIFYSAQTSEEIINAGEQLISSLYGGVPCEGLDVLRYRKFVSRVLSNETCVQICSLGHN
jgi:hypothetical protein